MDVEILSNKQRLDHLFRQVSQIEDEEMRAQWAKYLCVLVSGFIEESLRIALSKYASVKAHPNIAKFTGGSLRRITNLNSEKIKQLLGSFSGDWRETFEDAMTDEQKNAIDSIVANRHPIVHGRPVTITYVRVREYYNRVVEVINMICGNCLDS